MSRYINAEWLKAQVHNVVLANGALHGCVDKLCINEAPSIKTKEVKYFDEDEKVWKIGSVIVDETN